MLENNEWGKVIIPELEPDPSFLPPFWMPSTLLTMSLE